MNLAPIKIRDLVRIPDVQTVIRLESDETSVRKAASTFVVTADVGAHLHLLVESMKRPCGQGFFLQGDFGSGKSHFLSALFAFFSRAGGYEQLCNLHEELGRLNDLGRVVLPVAISLVHFRGSTPLESIVLEAVETALRRAGRTAVFTGKGAQLVALRQSLGERPFIDEFSTAAGIEPPNAPDWIEAHAGEALQIAKPLLERHKRAIPEVVPRERKEVFEALLAEVRAAGYDGCLLLIDELSEYFRAKPDAPQLNDDARTLQLLGELAAAFPLWIVAAVQESVERTGDIAQATFRKIKDRFPIKLHLSTLHIRDLIGKRLIEVTAQGERTILHIYEHYRSHFPNLTVIPSLFRAVYPVHPFTIQLLEGLGDLFSQHRGIVDFIHAQVAGDPSRAIAGILDRPCVELLAPDAIYDHFSARIAEFSSFYIYPAQIVPHLDECIDSELADPGDRVLARRLVRIIVLHAIHPTAKLPSARVLAELTACMLSFESPDANAQYVAEVLLDPVAAASRFLVRKPALSGTAADTVYEIAAGDDQGKVLEARIARVLKEIKPDDSRLFLGPLAELPESYAWPGPALWQDIVKRQITWRQSQRTVAMAVVTGGQEEALTARLEALFASGSADFGVVVAIGSVDFSCPHTAVWSVPLPQSSDTLFKEYFACKTVLGELRPNNPAEMPLLPLVRERLRKCEAAVQQALLQRIYLGSFGATAAEVDPALRQVMRFDRLLETAAEKLCEERYPDFKQIAPRGMPPSLRIYQRLFEEFACVGTLSLRDARAASLTESIETLAAPLGIVEVKNGNYQMSPQPSASPFLSYVFGLLQASGHRPRLEIMQELQTGTWGVPHEMACFLLSSLAQCGLITFTNNGRALPLENIKLMTAEQVDAIAPGELINQADRETITASCQFLLPSAQSGAFDLRRQRETWAAAIKFKTSAAAMLDTLTLQLRTVSGYAAFADFDTERLTQRAQRLGAVIDEIKVSYAARDGLERFAAAWRASGLAADDVTSVRQNARFLARQADKVVYVNHYLGHPSVCAAADTNADVGKARATLLEILSHPETHLIPDDGERMQRAFEEFKTLYLDCYRAAHTRFHAPVVAPALSRQGERNLLLLRRLAGLPALDRPPGTRPFIDLCDSPAARPCARNLAEELLRSAACGCGFIFGEEPETRTAENPGVVIDRLLSGYCAILKSADVLEAVAAHAFAIRDLDQGTSKRLSNLHSLLKERDSISVAALVDLLDENTIVAIGRALSGFARIEQRNFDALRNYLAGRRLNTARIRSIVEEWMGTHQGDVILSIEDAAAGTSTRPVEPLLWPSLHPHLFDTPETVDSGELARLAEALERRFPASQLVRRFSQATTETLSAFLRDETAHRTALITAWCILARRICAGDATVALAQGQSHFLDTTEAAAINRRIASLRTLTTAGTSCFPQRLIRRIALADVCLDAWADAPVRKDAVAAIGQLAVAGADWLSTLQAIKSLDCGQPVTVVVIDAVPPDVWLAAAAAAPDIFIDAQSYWYRLSTPGTTVAGLCELFGFAPERDPYDEFAQHSVTYHTIDGNEDYAWVDLAPRPKPAAGRIIRVAFFDRQVHDGLADLSTMGEKLALFLQRHLPGLREQCRASDHRLVLTTDHGLSFSEKGLGHGGVGVFEQAVFRAEWE